MGYTQEMRAMEVDTPLGKDVLLVRSFSGTEAISQLFFFGLDMLSENDSISYDSIVGKNVTIRTTLADESDRYLNGFISRFAQCATASPRAPAFRRRARDRRPPPRDTRKTAGICMSAVTVE